MSRINNRQGNGRAIAVHINNEKSEALHLCKLVCNRYESISRKTRNRDRENERNIRLHYYTNM